jgi:hypothetical protein
VRSGQRFPPGFMDRPVGLVHVNEGRHDKPASIAGDHRLSAAAASRKTASF